MPFAKNMGRNNGKTVSQNFSGKQNHKLLDHAQQCAKDALTASSKRVIRTKAELTGDSAEKIRKESKISPQNHSETVTNEHYKEIPKERYVSLEESQKIY